ncbi:EamA family transporter RarD [Acidobacteriota bacterium]
MSRINTGILYGLGAYTLWGFFPVYWKTLKSVPAFEILCHRTVWSLIFVAGLLALWKHWGWVKGALRRRLTLATFLVTSVLLAINWLTFIWAVNAGFIVEVSLGYFLNPLLNVLLGAVFLKERLRLWQGVAVALALGSVAYLIIGYGAFPWIALTLGFSFAFYGLLRKTAALGSLEGLGFETAILFLPALAFLVHFELKGTASFGHAGAETSLLLALAGVVTALPLIWFAHAARRVTLMTLGFMQYVAPTLHFILGVFVYGEMISRDRLIAFAMIWIALIIYTFEGVLKARTAPTA